MIESKSSLSSPNFVLFAVLFLIAMLACGCGSHPVTGTTIVGSIRVTADSAAISAGTTTQLHAMSTSSAGQTSDVTSAVAWSSANPTVAVVSSSGVLTGMSAGNATITAGLNGVLGAYTASVGAPAVSGLTLTPKSAAVFTRGKQAYTATAVYANNTSGDATAAATWSVTPASVATVSGGVVTGVAPGSYTVTAVVGTQTATAAGTVVDAPVSSIAVTPANASLAGGATQKFTATATYADGTTADVSKSFNWASSNTALLTIDANGLATAIGTTGSVTVSGQFGTVSSKVTVTLTAAATIRALVVTPTSSSIATGSAERHTATAIYSDGVQADVTNQATWSVVADVAPARVRGTGGLQAQARLAAQDGLRAEDVAAVNQAGVDTAGAPGTAAVQATVGGMSAQSTVIVTPATVQTLSIRATRDLFPVGASQPLQLVGQFSDGTTQDLSLTANWASSNPAVATIDQTGLAMGVSGGNVVFTASFGGVTASTVGYQVLSSPLVSLVLSVDNPITSVGVSQTPHLTGVYADGKTHDLTGLAKWESSDPSIVTISSAGLAFMKAPGQAQLVASVGGLRAVVGVFGIASTTASIDITPINAAFAQGTTMQMKALGHLTSGATVDLTSNGVWRSEDPTVLTIDANGIAKAGRVGTTRVTLTVHDQVHDLTQESADIQVTGAKMVAMKVLPYGPLVQGGVASSQVGQFTGAHFIACAIFDDNSFQDVTRDVVWSVSDFTTASVDTAGFLVGMKPGNVGLMAAAAGLSDTLPVTVTSATMQSAYLTPGGDKLPGFVTRQYKMMGVFSDGTVQDLTQDAVWLAPTPLINDVQAGGAVVGIQPGVGSVSAQYGYFTAATPVTVTTARLVSTVLTPANVTDRKFTLEQYTNVGTFDDGQVLDLGLDTSISTNAPLVAEVLPTGLTFTRKPGVAQINATAEGMPTTTQLTVTSNVVSSMAVRPGSPTIQPGGTQQFAAVATFDDGIVSDVSRMTQWISSNPAVLSVDASGLATAHTVAAATTVTLTAIFYNAPLPNTVATTTITVSAGTAPTLTSIAVTPQSTNVPSNKTLQFTATGTYTDESTQNLSKKATWTTSDPTVMVVDANGLGTPLKIGKATVTATVGTLTANAGVTVVQAVTVTSLVVKPTSSSIALGTAEQHTATAFYSDGTQGDVTGQVTWSVTQTPVVANAREGAFRALALAGAADAGSANPVATVNAAGVDTAMTPGQTMVQASMGGITSQSTVLVTAATVTSLAIRATQTQFPAGSSQPLALIGTFSDGRTQDLSLTGHWVSSDATVATIDSAGTATGLKAGAVTFSASFGGLSTSTVGYQVLPADLVSTTINVDIPILATGLTEQFHVIGTYSNGETHDLTSSATWQSTNASAFSVDSAGTGYAKDLGTAQILATVQGLTAIASVQALPLTIQSIDVLPVNPSFALGTTQQFTAIGHFSSVFVPSVDLDVSAVAVWRSLDPSVLTIDAAGRGKGGAAGATTVSATFLGVTGQTVANTVQVTNAGLSSLRVLPNTASVAAMTGQQYKAYGIFTDGSFQDVTRDVIWDTNDNTVASVDTDGYATGMKAGAVQVTARMAGKSASTPLTVSGAKLSSVYITPGNENLPIQTSRQYKMMGVFTDGSQQDLTQKAVWISPTPTLVQSLYKGQVLTVGLGVGEITAKYGYQSASTPVTITPATLVSSTLTPAAANARQGDLQQFTDTLTFSDGQQFDETIGVTYQSVVSASNSAISQSVTQILPSGMAYAKSPGVAVVQAAYEGSRQTTTWNVRSGTLTSLSVSPVNPTLFLGGTQQLTATGIFADGTTEDVTRNTTWTSTLPRILSIDQNGLATALSLTGLANDQLAALAGSSSPVTVPATASSGGQTRSFQATVLPPSAATLTSVAVSPSTANFAKGTTQQFTLTGTYSDGSTQDLSSQATWTTSAASVGTISSTGLASGAGVGSVQFTGSYGGKTSTTGTVSVTPATLTSIAVTPSSPSFAKGTTQQFTVIGTYTDGTTQNLTSSSTYASSNTGVVSVSAGGLATGTGTGSASVTISSGGQTVTTGTVSVTPATLASIAVNPSSASFAKGTTQQFTVIGTYTDGTTQNLTSSSTYTSSNTGVVSVSAGGLATGAGTGSASITVSSGSQTVTTGTVQVTPATLTSITVNPTSTHAAAGTAVQLTVTGTYTDGSTTDVSSSATWSSSDTSLATVTSTGLVTGVSPGLANIQAQVGTMTASSAVRVSAATLVSTAISPSGASFAAGLMQKFTLTGTFSDGSTQDLSSSATWTTSDGTVATVSSTGLATGVGAGSVQFTASYGGQTATTPTVMVTPATLVSIAVTPSSPNFAKGTNQQFRVTGTYTDGSMRDLTSTATFASSDATVVSISGSGLAQGLNTGSVQITVAAGGQTASTQTVTVTPATLTSVVITPNSPSVAVGSTQQFTATGTFSDGSTQDLSAQAVWMSSNPQVMTINQMGLASTFQVGGVQVSATINGMTVMSGVISVTPATLVSLSLTPNTVQIAKGTVRQMTATGTYTDGSTQNLSSMATWTTSDGTVVTVDANGLATGTGIGSATLTATLQGKTASTNAFQVTAATLMSIAFNPAHPTVAAGSSSQIRVIGTYSDGSTQDLSSTALYSSSNPAVATINSTGAVAGVAPGGSTITVQANGVTSSFNVTVSNATLVSLAITPANPAAFAKGTTQQFTATGTYSDGTTQNLSTSVSWSSSNTSAFTVDQNGLATGTGVGSGQLTAVYQGQTATTPSFQVTPATVSSLSVTPRNASIVAGSTQQYTATATYTDSTTQDVSGTATWSSSNQSAATISSTGFASAVAAGTAVLQAQYQGLSGTSSVTVTTAAVTLQQVVVARSAQTSGTVGGMQQYTATAVYSDQSTQDVTNRAVWTSSNTAVATVNSAGLASLVAAGSTTIQAQFGGQSGSMGLTVTSQAATLQSIAISPSSASVAKGLTQQFAATGMYSDGSTQNLTTQVSWQTSNTTIATIDNYGLATSHVGGSAQITANFQGQGSQVTLTVSAATLVSLALTPSSLNLANGTKQQIIATGTLSDGSTQDFTTSVNWSSTNTSDATVSASGVVTVLSPGQVTITAQAGGVSRSLMVNVTPATATSIQLTPASVTVPVGGVQQFQATAMFTDGTSQDVTSSVTYTTSNANVVTVDANGNLHGVGTGTATVTATLGSASTTTMVTITQVMLTSLAITPQNVSLADGLSQQLTATGTFANGSTQDLTNTVTWTSSNPQIASVSSTGKVTVTGIGTVTVTATTSGVSATTSVTATAAAVTAISVSPASTTLAAGQTQQYAATATFTDGSQQTITSSANWSVSDPTKGTISNSGSTKGFLTSSTAGMLNVVASLNGISGSAAVTVQAAALTVLRITPNPVSAPAGTTQQLTVTGSYTDGSTANLTASTTWTTNSASVATVNTTGLLQAIMPGSTTVQATVQGVSATDNVTVTPAVLNSIAVTPSAASVAKGLTQQMTAIGTYTDGSTADITSQVQWSSSSPAVATVSGTGLVSTLSIGTTTLTATLSGVSQTASITVTAAVLQSIAVTASQNSFALGLSLQLTAIGTYSDGTTQNLTNTATWTSSAPTVGMVSSTGLATGMTTGSFTARAAFGGKTGSLPLTVTAAVLQSIVVTPANTIIVNVLGTTQFTATGHYSDGTTQNITNSVHWSLSGPANVGTINQSGQLSGVHVGVAGTVTATSGTISGSTGFTVVGV